jgi:hypothetical protein
MRCLRNPNFTINSEEKKSQGQVRENEEDVVSFVSKQEVAVISKL